MQGGCPYPNRLETKVSEVSIAIDPEVSCMDQPISIVVSHLRPHQLVTLTLSASDYDGVQWSSSAQFRAGTAGAVDLAHARALPGSDYTGTWGMGLLASMHCQLDLGPCSDGYEFEWPARSDFTLTATDVRGRRVGEATFTRVFGPPSPSFLCEISYGTAATPWYTSTLYYGTSHTNGCQQWQQQPVVGTQPAVLAIGGSGESVPWVFAGALASYGFPVYALAYYGGQNLPHDFAHIPIEYFVLALKWLKAEVGPRPIVVYGFSRGSEAALLLASLHPEFVDAVILGSPSSVANECRCAGPTMQPSWTINGSAVPTNPNWNFPSSSPYSNPPTANEAGTIEVESIDAPFFMACGTADSLWTSCPYSRLILNHLNPQDRAADVLEVARGAGHDVGTLVPYEPIEREPNRAASERARERIWPQLIAFLRGIS
jgi:pimeloyl-ACP methyl ester carboxylesterase